VSAEDILSQPQPPPDERVSYGADPNQFLDVRLPRAKGPHSILLNIHGGYWRAKNDLKHAGHLCEALRKAGLESNGRGGCGGKEVQHAGFFLDSFAPTV
jgi:acetyl esterase/lipase